MSWFKRRRLLVDLSPNSMAAIDRLSALLQANLNQGSRIMKTLADLQADVAAETAVEQGAITLLGGLSAQIAALKSTQTDPATAAAIDALATSVEANSSSLAAAVTANTPAAAPPADQGAGDPAQQPSA